MDFPNRLDEEDLQLLAKEWRLAGGEVDDITLARGEKLYFNFYDGNRIVGAYQMRDGEWVKIVRVRWRKGSLMGVSWECFDTIPVSAEGYTYEVEDALPG